MFGDFLHLYFVEQTINRTVNNSYLLLEGEWFELWLL